MLPSIAATIAVVTGSPWSEIRAADAAVGLRRPTRDTATGPGLANVTAEYKKRLAELSKLKARAEQLAAFVLDGDDNPEHGANRLRQNRDARIGLADEIAAAEASLAKQLDVVREMARIESARRRDADVRFCETENEYARRCLALAGVLHARWQESMGRCIATGLNPSDAPGVVADVYNELRTAGIDLKPAARKREPEPMPVQPMLSVQYNPATPEESAEADRRWRLANPERREPISIGIGKVATAAAKIVPGIQVVTAPVVPSVVETRLA
jgi:hypothetical protein